MLNPALALLAWPAVAFVLFRALPAGKAAIWSVFLSFLFLPSSFEIDLPGIPAMDKASLPNLVLLLLVALHVPLRPHLMPRTVLVFGVVTVIGVVGTVVTNGDSLLDAEGVLPGMQIYEVFTILARKGLILIPFFVGWRLLGSVDAHRHILRVIVILGLAYSLLMLVEVRLSPQLHTWVYGYFPHVFAQHIREEGFRPVVFFRHGLWNSFFAATTALAIAALYRDARLRNDRSFFATPSVLLAATGYMLGVVVLCKSLGSLVQSVFVVPALLLLRRSTIVWIAMIMGALAMSYPVLRTYGVVPVAELVRNASLVSEERSQSLAFRFSNEDILLERAQERPVFGWGTWGRNRVFDEASGQDISVIDGLWIVEIGGSGWWGFVATFGLLFLPVMFVFGYSGRRARLASWPTVALALFVGVNMLELLPNSTLPPWTWLIAGSLVGWSQQSASPQGLRSASEVKAVGHACARS